MQIDLERLSAQLNALAECSATLPPAITRILYSEADQQARALLRRLCDEAGLVVREDGLGNLFARWVGSEPDLPAVATGSHIDAIPNSGRYDGTVGVLGAIAALRALKASGFVPRRSLEVLLFTAEEPTRFGIGCLGSRALAGVLGLDDLQALRDHEGSDLETLRQAAGFDWPLENLALPVGHYAAFVELHIEQGPLLEAAGEAIGVVTAIAAPATLRVALRGVGGHAGAVLMPGRRDALLAAAEIALAVEAAALQSGSPDTVATTGRFEILPGAVNSIPSAALLEIDIRDIAAAPRDATVAAIEAQIAAICARRLIEPQVTRLNSDPPATCDPALIAAVQAATHDAGVGPARLMVSRAYHDSLFMARICPTTMIFIPCRGGVSHRPDEYASPTAIAAGVEVLARTLMRLAW